MNKKSIFFLLFLGGIVLTWKVQIGYVLPRSSSVAGPFTPENTQIQFDLDETILEKSRAQLWLNIVRYFDYRLDLLFPLLFTNADPKYINCAIGHPWSFYYRAIKDPSMRPYIDGFMKLIASSHHVIPGVMDILVRLKEKGYSIAYATNKDRVSYEYTANYLGEPFSSIADVVLVYYRPQSDQIMQDIKAFIDNAEPMTEFKQIMQQVYAYSETKRLAHASVMKPSLEYTQKQRQIAGDKKILFFDDLSKNIAAAAYDANMVGIQVFQSAQSIIEPLFMLGVFDYADPKDAALLARLSEENDSGMLKKVKGLWQKIKCFFVPPIYVHFPQPVVQNS